MYNLLIVKLYNHNIVITIFLSINFSIYIFVDQTIYSLMKNLLIL